MIRVVQTGQAGKTKLLFDMHRLRKKIFFERMGWAVNVNNQGLEVDEFDLPQAIYLLSVNSRGTVDGSWRLLPSTGPTMIRDIWPDFLKTNPMPSYPTIWEASRFSVDTDNKILVPGPSGVNIITGELFCGLTELCLMCGIEKIFTLYDARIARILKKLNCTPSQVSEGIPVDQHVSQVGCFDISEEMLSRLRQSTGLSENLIDPLDVPAHLNQALPRVKAYAHL